MGGKINLLVGIKSRNLLIKFSLLLLYNFIPKIIPVKKEIKNKEPL